VIFKKNTLTKIIGAKQMSTTKLVFKLVTAALSLSVLPGMATEMIYTPINPSFGGNPNNGAVLLSYAQAQNSFKDPSIKAQPELTALQQFNQSLQRSVLSRLSSAATTNLLGPSGKLVPGSIDTGDYRIGITDTGNGVLQVTTTDKNTGETVQFQVGAN
jgi:curli production assembly/transport component CsgF